MSKVTECARALGEAIVDSDEYKQMQITEHAAMTDPDVMAAMNRYLELKTELDAQMQGSEPDASEIARLSTEMDDVQRQMNDMPAVDAMTASRQHFSEMMNQVNHVLEFIITGEQTDSCTGNCSGCSGCH